jgi:glycosyltransferase involved in cell wall biosynthesis
MAKHPDFYGSFDGGGRVAFAAVSQSQLERAPQAVRSQTLGVVPLAAPMVDPLPDVEAGDHALVLARITADKGQDIAARVCRRAGIPLVIAGPVAGVDDPAKLRRLLASDPSLAEHPDVRYFTEQVEPLIDGDTVRWVGGVQGEAKERLLQSARVLLATNRWAEPGATGVVEALGRGVPVVATPLGVLPSLVRHGVTGYLADSEDALVEALLQLDDLDRTACRAAGAAWTPRDMAQAYVSLYDQLLANSSSRPLAAAP